MMLNKTSPCFCTVCFHFFTRFPFLYPISISTSRMIVIKLTTIWLYCCCVTYTTVWVPCCLIFPIIIIITTIRSHCFSTAPNSFTCCSCSCILIYTIRCCFLFWLWLWLFWLRCDSRYSFFGLFCSGTTFTFRVIKSFISTHSTYNLRCWFFTTRCNLCWCIISQRSLG